MSAPTMCGWCGDKPPRALPPGMTWQCRCGRTQLPEPKRAPGKPPQSPKKRGRREFEG